ncbi:hypothetical protein JCM8097_002222 [Rhodosporidiobolus ruineniae]
MPKATGAAPSSAASPVASTSKAAASSSSPSSSSTPAAPASSSSSTGPRAFPLVDTSVSWPKSYPAGAGLHNLGNTCFLNSALQCLLHTPPLVRYVEGAGHSQQNCALMQKKKFCMTCAMKGLVKASFSSGSGRPYSPKMVVGNMKQMAKHFRLGRQEDSHEFLRFCVDAMQASALAGKGAKLPPAIQHQTFIHQIFGGRLRSRVHCMSCEHNSDTFDSILDLSLDLGNRADSLRDALGNLVKPDKLTGGNKYKCEKCKKLVNAEKRFTIEDAPLVLTIHLKRFTPLGRKISGLIKYPEVLKLGPYMSNPSLDPTYRLYALILHSGGGPHSGHYTSFVRASNGKWHDMNDESVSPVSPNQALQARNAYVLFYMREKGDALKGVIAGQAGAAAVNGNGKRPRESIGANGAAGTPIKRVKPDSAASSSPATASIRPPYALPSPASSGPQPPAVLTASKTASPRVSISTNPAPSPPVAKAPNPFLPPSSQPSPSAVSSSLLTQPVPAKQFVSRVNSSSSSSGPSSSSTPSANGGAKKQKIADRLGKKLDKRARKEAKRQLMGLVVPEEKNGGKGVKHPAGANRPKVISG